MDPNAALRYLNDNPDPDDEDVISRAFDLRDWIRAGGFIPDWNKYPIGRKIYEKITGNTVRPESAGRGRHTRVPGFSDLTASGRTRRGGTLTGAATADQKAIFKVVFDLIETHLEKPTQRELGTAEEIAYEVAEQLTKRGFRR